MKKYQLWLQRKTYSQHLNNLVRIKMVSSERKLASKLTMRPQRSSLATRHSPNKQGSSLLSARDQSYLITSRELQRHNMRLFRSDEIVRENKEIVKRLNGTKPFVSNSRPVDPSNYKLKRRMQRNNEEQNEELKDRNYRQFLQMYRQNAKADHKYELTVVVEQHELRISTHPSVQLRIEILAPHSIAKSQLLPPSQLLNRSFQFSFPHALPEHISLRLHSFKNLSHSIIGEFKGKCPGEQWQRSQWRGLPLQGSISVRARLTKLQPKFRLVDPFQV